MMININKISVPLCFELTIKHRQPPLPADFLDFFSSGQKEINIKYRLSEEEAGPVSFTNFQLQKDGLQWETDGQNCHDITSD